MTTFDTRKPTKVKKRLLLIITSFFVLFVKSLKESHESPFLLIQLQHWILLKKQESLKNRCFRLLFAVFLEPSWPHLYSMVSSENRPFKVSIWKDYGTMFLISHWKLGQKLILNANICWVWIKVIKFQYEFMMSLFLPKNEHNFKGFLP